MADNGLVSRKRTPRGLLERETIVISTEGEKTEPNYFKKLQRKYRGINITIVPRIGGNSDPRQVLQDLVEYKALHSTRKDKIIEHWIVIDHDGRADKILDEVVADAKNHGCYIADSNPCFELWLIMHCKIVQQFPGLEGSAAVGGCEKVIEALRKHIEPNYHKTKYNVSAYVERREVAIENAKNSDKCRNETWLNQIGSRVYKLVESIINSATSPNSRRH